MLITMLVKTAIPVAALGQRRKIATSDPVEESGSRIWHLAQTVWSTKKISKMTEKVVDLVWVFTPDCMSRRDCHYIWYEKPGKASGEGRKAHQSIVQP
jgi:hypothetical protein